MVLARRKRGRAKRTSNVNLSTEKMLLWQILFPRKENKAVDLWQILFLRPHSADGTLWAIGPYQGITNFHNNMKQYQCMKASSVWKRMYIRAHRDWPLRPKIENRDSHTWIFIGNWILMWVCFLHFFYLSTSSAAKMRFNFLYFLHGKNAQNRPENQQNWILAKIGLKSDNLMK